MWMAEKDTSSLLIFEGNGYGDRVALRGRTVFAGGSWDARSNPREATSVFFFLSSFFYPLAFYFLLSLLNLLASRDLCENVFLVVVIV